jgi:hypothetical protein
VLKMQFCHLTEALLRVTIKNLNIYLPYYEGQWDLWWTKWHWGRFSPSTTASPANLHSTKFSILTITRGKYNRPEVADVPSGPSFDSTPHYANFRQKKIPHNVIQRIKVEKTRNQYKILFREDRIKFSHRSLR